MARVKQGHRRLENELYSAEKMAATAWIQGLMPYPQAELEEALRDLAFVEFHDILPGSAIPAGEEGALRTIGHGLEILSRVKAEPSSPWPRASPRRQRTISPYSSFNPHGHAVKALVECELEPWEPNTGAGFWRPRLFGPGSRELPAQAEKEESNLSVEWRKRVVFEAELAPSRLNRFSCKLERVPEKPKPAVARTRARSPWPPPTSWPPSTPGPGS